eukprot:61897_1
MDTYFKFKLLNDDLSNDEFNQFLMKCGRSFLGNIFFSAYQTSPKKLIKLITITEQIIDSREIKSKQPNLFCCTNLNNLPGAILCEFAVYLETQDSIRFARVNRKIYVSMYSPSKISCLSYNTNLFKHLKCCYPSALRPQYINRFKRITKLCLDIVLMNLCLSNLFDVKFDRINTLETYQTLDYGYLSKRTSDDNIKGFQKFIEMY